jgi:HEAT repeat protein
VRHKNWILVVIALAGCPAFASSATSPTPEALKGRIHRSMQKGQSLKDFYAQLAHEYGGAAVKPLLEIAGDDRNDDETRWAALFGLARLAGKESLGVIGKFLSNPSWMLRDAALKTAAALDAKEMAPQIAKRLKDDALIVRTTAVQAIEHLGLKQLAPKLVDALFDPANFHGGKALWIHKYILQAIREFHYDAAAPKLVELLQKSEHDSALQAQVIQTLESLTGRSFSNKPIPEQIYLWKRNLLSEATF